jgi:hypothetical protein
MRITFVTLNRLRLPSALVLFLLGCWEGEKPTPLKRVDSSRSPAAEEKAAKPSPDKSKQTQENLGELLRKQGEKQKEPKSK